MRVHKDIEKAGTIEYVARVIDERPESYETDDTGARYPIYGMDRDVCASYTHAQLARAKRWLTDSLKVHARLHRNDDILVEGEIVRCTWSEAYTEFDEKFGWLKLTDDEWETVAVGSVYYTQDGKLRVDIEDYR